jgi:hypothetical protein
MAYGILNRMSEGAYDEFAIDIEEILDIGIAEERA